MGFFSSKKKDILKAAIILLEDQNPEGPMFMLVYRHCQFYAKTLDPGYLEELDLKTIDKYKNEPIYPEKFQLLKSYMKAYILHALNYKFIEAVERKEIKKDDQEFLWNEMNISLKKINLKAYNIHKLYFDKKGAESETQLRNLIDIISKECFDNNLGDNCKKSVLWYFVKIFQTIQRSLTQVVQN